MAGEALGGADVSRQSARSLSAEVTMKDGEDGKKKNTLKVSKLQASLRRERKKR